MAYGKIKADAVIWDNSGTDVEESMSNIAGKLNASGGSMTGNLTLNAQNELRLADSDSSNYIALQSAGTVGTNSTWTLPSDAPAAGEVLKVTSVSSNNPTLEWGSGGTIKKIHSFVMSTRTSGSNSATNQFTWAVNYNGWDDVANNDMHVIAVVPTWSSSNNCYGVGVRFNGGNDVKFCGQGIGSVNNHSYMGHVMQSFRIPAGTLAGGQTDITWFTETSGSNPSIYAPNNNDDASNRLASGTTCTLIIYEYKL